MQRSFPGHLIVSLLACIVLQSAVRASPITRGAFTAAAKVEGFENLHRPSTPSASQNLPIPFTFRSGVVLTSPAPNRADSSGVFIVDGDGFFGLYPYEDVPDGTAYLGQANPSLLTGPIVFTFPTLEARVGALIAVAMPETPDSWATLSAYGADGKLLESLTTRGIQPDKWATNFIGIQRPEGIKSIAISSDGSGVLRLDDLTFEALADVPPPPAAPLPAALGMAAVAVPVCAFIARARRRRSAGI
jgi:hypothetical protein